MPFTSFFAADWNASQSTAISVDIAMLVIVGCCLFAWCSDIYRLCPGWGAVRRFDSDGNEDRRARESLLQKDFDHRQAAALEASEAPKLYGALGPPTWGVLESPNQQEVMVNHPVHGQVKVRSNFEETQQLRRESTWWAKDERYFAEQANLRRGELCVNEPFAKLGSAI
ncbi:unnamed protein product [Durusdinium trenchii]|uniref:Uncharacterized protein n=2 Tax=Durusdinium trenchii TaxID=1381693 RepID=A0ABP0JND4_9DINO